MNDRPIEERLRDALDGLEPPPESARRAREAAVRAVARTPQAPAAPAARRSHRRRALLWTALAGAVLTGAAAATAVMVGGGGSKTTVPAGPEAEAAIAESSVLARAPWLVQAEGSPYVQEVRRLPSLRFPEGTTYSAALIQLARSVAARGGLPAGARRGPALPRGAVWAPSPKGPRLDLTAPFSYVVPEGRILPPSFAIRGSATPAEAVRIVQALKEGRYVGEAAARHVTVNVPRLRPCQRLPRRAPCALDAVPESAGSSRGSLSRREEAAPG